VIVVVPDLEDIRPTSEVVYVSPAGPITGADMYWGFQRAVGDKPFMRHQFGYTRQTLLETFQEAGFADAMVTRIPGWELLASARKGVVSLSSA
jgi:hypothetical protein